MKKIVLLFLSVILLAFMNNMTAQDRAFHFNATYTGDLVAHAKMNNDAFITDPVATPGIGQLLRFEAAIEESYLLQLTDNIAIQPDLHYSINPDANETFENAIVASYRLQVGIS